MAAVNVVNPQDLTGRMKADAEAKVADEKREAAKRMTMVTAQAVAEKEGVIDLSTQQDESDESDEAVSVAKPKKQMRVNTNLEAVTIGHGSWFDFEPGQKYTVDADVYDYLDERGFVWH